MTTTPPIIVPGTASFSPCGRYRYDLTRRWGPGPLTLWVMLNPSTADEHVLDPTIRRCVGFSHRDGAGGLAVVNLFAYRSTDPTALGIVDDPTGPGNIDALTVWFGDERVDRIVCAWGAWLDSPAARNVDRNDAAVGVIAAAHGRDTWCLGTTRSGAPRHPLYVHRDTPFERWDA